MSSKKMNKDIKDIILEYGKKIIRSEEFKETFSQTHHLDTTVGDHTLGVTVEAVKICLRRSLTDDETLKNVVVASLCHDLGIIGRDGKYKNNVQCLMRHPIDSLEAYKSVTGEENEKVLDSINCHMFPLKLRMPGYKEGWILMFADKTASIKEKIGRPAVTVSERDDLLASAKMSGENAE